MLFAPALTIENNGDHAHGRREADGHEACSELCAIVWCERSGGSESLSRGLGEALWPPGHDAAMN